MALNPEKSDAILLGTRQRSRCYATLRSVDVAGCSVSLSDHIKILDVTLDSHLSLDRRISSICKSIYYHIWSLRHIRSAITDDIAKSVASPLVCSRLDYANSLLYGTTQKISLGSSASKTHLPESFLVTLSNTLCSTQPVYLHSLLNYHTPTRSLRSANTNLLSVPGVHTAFASRGFSVAEPTAWNSLPSGIRDSSSTHTFRRLHKTHCFQQAFGSP